MTGLCRKCDCALKAGDMVFIKVLDHQMIFRVICSTCKVEYAAIENGDLYTPPYPVWTS